MRLLKVNVLTTIVFLGWAWGQTAPEFGQIWQKPTQEPLIYTIGDSGSWNSDADMWDWNWGHVLQDADTFKLYIGASDGSNFSIGMWHSMDLESGWSEYSGNPILEHSATGWDSVHVGGPMVLKDGDVYKMWYTGTNHGPTHGGDKTIGYATSTDGVNWVKHPDPLIDPSLFVEGSAYVWLRNPFVLLEADTFKMWLGVSRVSPTYESIHYGYSLDGIDWVFPNNGPVLEPKPNRWLEIPSVQKYGDQYVMWAMEGTYDDNFPAETITARSTDGIHWRRDHLYNPVLRRNADGNFGETGVGIYDVIETDDGYTAVYGGWGGVAGNHVGLAEYSPTIVPAGDVSGTWTKAGSPIRVQGEITIPNGETLTIEPGTTIEFLGHDPLNVQGQLLAVGTESESIRFMVDDTMGFGSNAGSNGVWGGVRFEGTSATNDSSFLKYCEIEYAKTFATGPNTFDGPHGGGMYIENCSKIRIEKCLIQHNRAIGTVAGGYAAGAGIGINNNANPEIVGNLIQYNTTRHLIENDHASGSGIVIYDRCDPYIVGNTIRHNSATEVGGGVAISTSSNPKFFNNLIVQNECIGNNGSDGAGGGVGVTFNSRPEFINNTIADNTAGWAGGIFLNNARPIFINSIIANNQDTDNTDARGSQIGTYNMGAQSLTFQNSCLEGGPTDINWDTGTATVNFEESLSIDPQLTQTYTLSFSSSPCLGAGTPSCTIDGVTYNALPQDIYGHVCPDPPGSLPDMGAIESVLSGHIITSAWDWWEWPESPVFMPGTNGTYDDVSLIAPNVLFHEGQYHMWYAGYDGNRMRICHATSSTGVEWTRDPANPVLTSDPTTWHDNGLNTPKVVIVDDVFHMWFLTNDRTGHATSPDGIEWTFSPDPVLEGTLGEWDSDIAAIADVIYKDSIFHAWYTGANNNTNRIGYATSTDGIEWVKDVDNNPVFGPSDEGWDSGMFYASSVIYNGGYYYMWYSAKENTNGSRIGRASSLNGINWTRTTAAEPEIGYGEAGSWNDEASFYPAALLHQGKYEIWFNGAPSSTSGWRIGYATMEPVATDPQYIEMPQSFMLSQNYPNPFNPMTHIRYSLPENGDMRLVIYDLLGREVLELVNDFRSVGNYETTWYGLDQQGNQVSTGVYFARLEAGRNVDVIKMLYLK
jgi:predicted GH43/DUF377 family glycosyl hydrolase